MSQPLPTWTSVQHLSFLDLHELLETSQQLLLPRPASCSMKFLHQILTGKKNALTLLEARHFWLTEHSTTKAKKLAAMCEEDQVARNYIPSGGTSDREFLVQVLATLCLPTLVEKQKEVLARKYRIAPETLAVKTAPFFISQDDDAEAFLASAMPERSAEKYRYVEDLAAMAHIRPESFPVRTRSPKRSPNRSPPPKFETERTSPAQVNKQSYEFQRDAAIFHGSDSRLNSPSMQQLQFEANAARFHGGTPSLQRDAPPTQGSAYERNKANFYAVTPPQKTAEADMSRSYRQNQEKFFGATPANSRGSTGFKKAAENFFE